jgi:hypothetical protein
MGVDADITNLSRYLVLSARGGSTGSYSCPPEYVLFKAAKECNCTPWELLEQAEWWRDWAIKIISAENEAQKIIADRK